MESRIQGWRPRPRTDPLEAKAKDQGHGSKYSQKKRSSKIFFRRSQKKGLQKIFFRRSLLEETTKKVYADFPQVFCVFQQNFNGSKIVLSSSRGQGNFRGLEASRPRPRTSKCVLEAKDVLEDSTSDTYTAQVSREILSARYRQTRHQKNQIAAVTHTGEIFTR